MLFSSKKVYIYIYVCNFEEKTILKWYSPSEFIYIELFTRDIYIFEIWIIHLSWRNCSLLRIYWVEEYLIYIYICVCVYKYVCLFICVWVCVLLLLLLGNSLSFKHVRLKTIKRHFIYIILLRSFQVSWLVSWFQVGIGGWIAFCLLNSSTSQFYPTLLLRNFVLS